MSDDAQFWRDLLAAMTREIDDGEYGQPWRGTENAPGHAHDVPGVWDADNGSKAGKPCAWCMTWNRARAALAASPAPSISKSDDALLTAARGAILALARSAERDPAFQRDYEALSSAIDAATHMGAGGTSD
ncbi:hypothetical protein [Burkholderia gladioli]|uniref:hypothetical protein n=1 Tax=Burkholderia gladioli TaxID=28095 RepID=UPI000BF06219|nr:hypothetical protein [Burkholderia gladioli]PEH83789.1 hypothetical protein CRM95_01715 [Burkholderia gladioli]